MRCLRFTSSAAQAKRATPKPGTQEAAVQEAEAVRQLAQDSYSAERFRLPRDLTGAPDTTRDPRRAALPKPASVNRFCKINFLVKYQ